MSVRQGDTAAKFGRLESQKVSDIVKKGRKKLPYQIPPTFLWWPAIHVILSALLFQIFLSLFFLLNSSNVCAIFLLVSIFYTFICAFGYLKYSFTLIYIHFSICLVSIFLSLLVIPIVFYDQKLCHEEQCLSISEWSRGFGVIIVPIWVYCYCIINITSHLLTIPVIVEIMKFAAGRKAVQSFLDEQEAKEIAKKPSETASLKSETTVATIMSEAA